jgi:hypothetical protein
MEFMAHRLSSNDNDRYATVEGLFENINVWT